MFDTATPGTHTYILNSIADDNYKSPIQAVGSVVGVERQVHALPSVQFVEPEQSVFQCTSRTANPYKMKMLLSGMAPFHVSLEQKHDNQHVQNIEKTIESSDLVASGNKFEYSFVAESISQMGKHDFIVDMIVDATTCQTTFDKTVNLVQTSIEIADQARITTFNKPVVCIGDLLSYTLQGTPPFTIGYSWQGIDQEDIIVADPMFSMWAGFEGEVLIKKVCNSAGCCDDTVASDPKMKTIVKPLPKAMIDSGLDLIDDIREGDESAFTVEFEGEPPFSFTYTRSKHGGQEEVFTVSDIQTTKVVHINQWSVATSQEGTFRVTSIQDQHCSFPRRLSGVQGANVVLGPLNTEEPSTNAQDA